MAELAERSADKSREPMPHPGIVNERTMSRTMHNELFQADELMRRVLVLWNIYRKRRVATWKVGHFLSLESSLRMLFH